MSYTLEIDARPDSWEVVRRLAAATHGPRFVSLVAGPRRRWLRELGPSVRFDGRDADDLLDDRASPWEDEFTLSPRRDALARTVLMLARELATGWTLRSYCAGDPLRREVVVTAGELAVLVRCSALDRHVLYRVR